jgi:predicted permease
MATTLRFVTGTLADVRLAARRLAATPAFTLFAIVSLALGLGVTTAVYSAVDALFLRGIGIRQPDRVAFVTTPRDGRVVRASLSDPDFSDVRDTQRSFQRISASLSTNTVVATVTMTELLMVEAVDGDYFSTVDVSAAMGRTLLPSDETSAVRVAVLSTWLWRSRFGSDPAVVGRSFQIGGQSFEVVGVVPDRFNGINRLPATRLWIPLSVERALDLSTREPGSMTRDERRLSVFGRLRPAVDVATAAAELATIAANLNETHPPAPSKVNERVDRVWHAKTIADIEAEDSALNRISLVLVAMVALVLVVACTNLANLVLARGTLRRQELTVRSALGASRWRLVREQTIESALLAAGGALGSAMVFQTLRHILDTEFSFFSAFGGVVTLTIETMVDARVVAIAGVSLLLSLIVFGLEPAFQLTRSSDLRSTLAEGGGSVGTPRVKRQRRLLRYQVAISVGFFIVATMFVRYTIAEAAHDTGVAMDRMGVALVNLRAQRWDEARVRTTVERVLDEAREDPSLSAVAVSSGMPFGIRIPITLAIAAPGAATVGFNSNAMAASTMVHEAMGVRILHGRSFEPRDFIDDSRAIIISEFTARTLFGSAAVVGRTLMIGQRNVAQQPHTVVGVASNTDVVQILDDPKPFAYLPLTHYDRPALLLTARSTVDSDHAIVALRDALRRAGPDLPVSIIGSGRRVLAGQFVFLRAAGVSALSLGALTLVLAMVGLFGIQSHVVAHRTREIGVRMSIGATRGEIRRMVLKDGYLPVLDGLAFGLLIGLIGRALVVRYLEIDVPIVDPWMLIVVPIPVFLSAFCACVLPAQRAAGVDPNVALRQI